MRIGTGPFSGHIGVGPGRWRSSRVTNILATIPFPYDRPPSSAYPCVWCGVCVCAATTVDVNSRQMHVCDLKEDERISYGRYT